MVRHSEPMTARAHLGWSRDRLAGASDVPLSAIYLLERLGSAGSEDDKRILQALTRAARAATLFALDERAGLSPDVAYP